MVAPIIHIPMMIFGCLATSLIIEVTLVAASFAYRSALSGLAAVLDASSDWVSDICWVTP